MPVLAGAKNPTGQTVLLKKVFLRKLDFFFSRFLLGWLISLLSNAVIVCRMLSSFPLVVRHPILRAIIVSRLRHPLLSPSAVTVVVIHRRRCPPPPSSASAAIIATLCLRPLSPPTLVLPFCSLPPNLACRVVRCYCCPPSPSLSAAAVFHRCSHHHHSAVSAVSHCPLSSFPIAVRRPITRVVVVRHHRHPPPSSFTITIPTLVLPPTRY